MSDDLEVPKHVEQAILALAPGYDFRRDFMCSKSLSEDEITFVREFAMELLMKESESEGEPSLRHKAMLQFLILLRVEMPMFLHESEGFDVETAHAFINYMIDEVLVQTVGIRLSEVPRLIEFGVMPPQMNRRFLILSTEVLAVLVNTLTECAGRAFKQARQTGSKDEMLDTLIKQYTDLFGYALEKYGEDIEDVFVSENVEDAVHRVIFSRVQK